MSLVFPLSPLRVAVFISGGGTTLRNLLAMIEAKQLDARVALVVSSTPKAGGLKYAAEADIPNVIVERKRFDSDEAYGHAVFDHVRNADVHLVVMGGFLKFVPIPDDFAGRVVNIHPSLIPAFCGSGMYGHHVHQAVIEAKASASGCTVHFVDNQYDHGPIILQRSVPVLPDDTADTLAGRVFEQECLAYPEALELFRQGKLRIDGPRVIVDA